MDTNEINTSIIINEKWYVNFWNWFISNYTEETLEKGYDADPKKKLLYNMKVTASNRYNASSRLSLEQKVAFLTTTVISLGLIIIPLIQLSLDELVINSKFLTMVQIVLAVCILVYSIIIGMSRYESRVQSHRASGDNIRDLIREYRGLSNEDSETLKNYTVSYNRILEKSENHNAVDYLKTRLNYKKLFKITGIKRFFILIEYYIIISLPFIIPIILLLFEFTFISDMLGVTKFYLAYFPK